MSVVMQINPFDFFADTQGDPLDAGYVWIGLPNTDPRQYPVTAYYDEDLTIPAAMPLRTVSGYITRNGSPTFLYINGNYSVMVQDKNQQQLFYIPDFLLIGSGTAVTLGDLANTTDPTKGVSLIPTAERLVIDIATLRTLPKTGGSIAAFVEGYYLPGDGGGGHYLLDAADVTSVDNGGTIIVAADGGRWKLIFQGGVSVLQFGVKADAGATDNSNRLQACRDWVASGAVRNHLYFPAGIYGYSVSPNWAIPAADIQARGQVTLRYSGIGNAVIFDAGATALDLVYNMSFGVGNRFIVECPSTALDAVFVRSVHHSKIGITARGAGTAHAGLHVQFAVCTEFDVVVSVNEAGWYLGAKPAVGIMLDKRLVNETASYCKFPNPVIEGPDVGIYLANTLGNVFKGGTSEACSQYGVFGPVGASGDRFDGTDFEANGVSDVYALGTGIEIDSCDSDNEINFGAGATLCRVIGGRHKDILLDIGSIGCSATDTIYNRSNNGGTFSDGGTNSIVRGVRNGGTNAIYLTGSRTYDPPSIPTGTTTQADVTVLGAKFGDSAKASFSIPIGVTTMTAAVSAVDTVTVSFTNLSGVPVDLSSGTLTCFVQRGN